MAQVAHGVLFRCETTAIHKAMDCIRNLKQSLVSPTLEVIIEDARTRGGSSIKAQGAGSIKRDCGIWEAFLKDLGIEYRFTRLSKKSITKKDPTWLKLQTGWSDRTSQHARDAACLLLPYINTKQ